MERTVPRVASEEIELYLRTYYSLLRSTAEVRIRTLEEAHAGMRSLLHGGARDQFPDISTFVYCILRLPSIMPLVRLVVLGQSQETFANHKVGNVNKWEEVSAPARRRRCFFDGHSTLACLITSRSDIDDIIPTMTAYQIEWNKIHLLMRQFPGDIPLEDILDNPKTQKILEETLEITWEEFEPLRAIWGTAFPSMLAEIAAQPRDLSVQLLSGSLSAYRRAIHSWWERIEKEVPEIMSRPLYFVSSNAHSIINLLTGFALQYQEELIDYLSCCDDPDLYEEWQEIQKENNITSKENFFYYVFKKYKTTPRGQVLDQGRHQFEKDHRITRVTSKVSFDLEAQVFELNSLEPSTMDPRLGFEKSLLQKSDALILNIDYPLGLASYDVLRKVSDHAGELIGVYIMGKAATLNAVIGDVMIHNVIYDEHSRNTYLYNNCFDTSHVAPYLNYGTVLDNQKAVSVRGTFLQNPTYMDVFYREGYTCIEMEAGPYLSAVYEMFRPARHPVDQIVNLYELPFDLGMLHYASDKPLSRGQNLGAGSLSYYGMAPTYASALAILRRIFQIERQRLSS
jgi:hypothetical protein